MATIAQSNRSIVEKDGIHDFDVTAAGPGEMLCLCTIKKEEEENTLCHTFKMC